MTDCPLCGAPAPAYGDLEHRWDCPDSMEQRYKRYPMAYFPPRNQAPKEQLLRMALECERGWGAGRPGK